MREASCFLSTPVLIAALLSTTLVIGATGERRTLPDGQVVDASVCTGVSRWRLIPHLWTHKTVTVRCPGTTVCHDHTAPTSTPTGP